MEDKKFTWRRLLRRWGFTSWHQGMLTTALVLVGVALGLGLARMMNLPEEQKALIGTLTTLITWLADEVFNLPSRETRAGRIIHGSLRMISLIGFMLALQSLAVLNGWENTN